MNNGKSVDCILWLIIHLIRGQNTLKLNFVDICVLFVLDVGKKRYFLLPCAVFAGFCVLQHFSLKSN